MNADPVSARGEEALEHRRNERRKQGASGLDRASTALGRRFVEPASHPRHLQCVVLVCGVAITREPGVCVCVNVNPYTNEKAGGGRIDIVISTRGPRGMLAGKSVCCLLTLWTALRTR